MSEAARRLVPPLAAVTAVVVVIVLLLVINGRGTTRSSTAGPTVESPAASTSTSVSPSPSQSPTPSPTPHRTRSTPPVAEPSATATPRLAKVPVTVLNNSRRTGLAHRAAAQLSAGGWPIRQVGNFTGRIPVSTVYYAPGGAREARALARQYPAIQRVHPRFSGLPGHGLTLVVTREWPA